MAILRLLAKVLVHAKRLAFFNGRGHTLLQRLCGRAAFDYNARCILGFGIDGLRGMRFQSSGPTSFAR